MKLNRQQRYSEAAIDKPERNVTFAQLVLPALLFVTALGCTRIAVAEQRVALVIGNSAYPAAPLKNPLNDARALAKSLNQLGFDVLLKTNLNQKGMVDAIREFSARIKEGDVALFYYSGHGMQVRGRNFLIPVDADIRSEDEVPYSSFDVSQVLDKLEAARARANIVILDACRNNPFVRTFRSSRVGLAQMDAPGGTLIAFSTAPGSEARDGDGDLGTYTRHLVTHMTTPELPVEIMFRRVREGVTAETRDRQVPWESSSLKGDLYFSRAAEIPVAASPPTALAIAQRVDPLTVELAFWDSIKSSSNRADFEAYLDQYPQGRFAALARNRMKVIQQPALAAANPQTASPARASPDSEKERAELIKALENERKQRDKDALAVKQEMESLRTELLKFRGTSPTPDVAASGTARAAAPKASVTPSDQPAQIALAKPSAPATGSQPFGAEWEARIALLEKSRGQLTFSKAVAILLDISAAEELSLLVIHEREIRMKAWHSAYAIGTDTSGNLVWGGSYRLRNAAFAFDTALEFCAKAATDSCKVILVNGDLQENNLMVVAKQLGGQRVAGVRNAYLQSLKNIPMETVVGGGGDHRSVFTQGMGYSPSR